MIAWLFLILGSIVVGVSTVQLDWLHFIAMWIGISIFLMGHDMGEK